MARRRRATSPGGMASSRCMVVTLRRARPDAALTKRHTRFQLQAGSRSLLTHIFQHCNQVVNGASLHLRRNFGSALLRSFPRLPQPKRFDMDKLRQADRPRVEVPMDEEDKDPEPVPPDQVETSEPEILARLNRLRRPAVNAPTTIPSHPGEKVKPQNKSRTMESSLAARREPPLINDVLPNATTRPERLTTSRVKHIASRRPKQNPTSESLLKAAKGMITPQDGQPPARENIGSRLQKDLVAPTDPPSPTQTVQPSPTEPKLPMGLPQPADIRPILTPILPSSEKQISPALIEGQFSPATLEQDLDIEPYLTWHNFHLPAQAIHLSRGKRNRSEKGLVNVMTRQQRQILLAYHRRLPRGLHSFYQHHAMVLANCSELFDEFRRLEKTLRENIRICMLILQSLAEANSGGIDPGSRARTATIWNNAAWTQNEFIVGFGCDGHMIRTFHRHRVALAFTCAGEQIIQHSSAWTIDMFRDQQRRRLISLRSERISEIIEFDYKSMERSLAFLLERDPFPHFRRLLHGPTGLLIAHRRLGSCWQESRNMQWNRISYFTPSLPSRLARLTDRVRSWLSVLWGALGSAAQLQHVVPEIWGHEKLKGHYPFERINRLRATARDIGGAVRDLQNYALLLYGDSAQELQQYIDIQQAAEASWKGRLPRAGHNFELNSRGDGHWSYKNYRDEQGRPVRIIINALKEHNAAIKEMKESSLLGLSVETVSSGSKAAFLITVASEATVALFHFPHKDRESTALYTSPEVSVGIELSRLLQDPTILKVGENMDYVSDILRRRFAMYLTTSVDIGKCSSPVRSISEISRTTNGRADTSSSIIPVLIRNYFDQEMVWQDMDHTAAKIVSLTKPILDQAHPLRTVEWAATKAYASLQLYKAMISTSEGLTNVLSHTNGQLLAEKITANVVATLDALKPRLAPDPHLYKQSDECPLLFPRLVQRRQFNRMISQSIQRLQLTRLIRRQLPVTRGKSRQSTMNHISRDTTYDKMLPQRTMYLLWHVLGYSIDDIASYMGSDPKRSHSGFVKQELLSLLKEFDLPFHADNLRPMILDGFPDAHISTRRVLELRSRCRDKKLGLRGYRRGSAMNHSIDPYALWQSEDLSIAEICLVCLQWPQDVVRSIIRSINTTSSKDSVNDLETQLNALLSEDSFHKDVKDILFLTRSSPTSALEHLKTRGLYGSSQSAPSMFRIPARSDSSVAINSRNPDWGTFTLDMDVDRPRREYEDDVAILGSDGQRPFSPFVDLYGQERSQQSNEPGSARGSSRGRSDLHKGVKMEPEQARKSANAVGTCSADSTSEISEGIDRPTGIEAGTQDIIQPVISDDRLQILEAQFKELKEAKERQDTKVQEMERKLASAHGSRRANQVAERRRISSASSSRSVTRRSLRVRRK